MNTLTADQVVSAAPPGATVTLQMDLSGDLLAWYIRMPSNVDRSAGNAGHKGGLWRPGDNLDDT